MADAKSILAVVLCVQLLGQASSSHIIIGAVYVKLDYYSQQDRDSCDHNWLGSDYCDPYFIISASTPSKILGTFASTEFDNAPRVIHFGNSIGQLSNPLVFHFTNKDLKPTDSLQVSVTVMDKDPGGANTMCSFSEHLSVPRITLFANNTVNSSWTAQFIRISASSPGHALSLAVWITCMQNYYQAGCSVHCDPTRFGCSSTGSVICPTGFMAFNGSCTPTDKCLQQGPSFCQNRGQCAEDLRGQPVCQCPMNFTGPHCELETHPCQRNATWCSHGTCQTFDSNGTSVCVCDKGFTGYHCNEDVDECRLVKGLCGSEGDCENSVGSFRCVCRDGFSGVLCQFQPPTPPSMRASVAVATPNSEFASPLTESLAVPLVLLAALIIVVCALAGIVAGIMLYNRKRTSRVELRVGNVVYRQNSPHPVTIEQPNVEPVESTYYEEVDNEQDPVSASVRENAQPGTPITSNFSNSAYERAQTEQSQLTLNSRSYSRKNCDANSQLQQQQQQKPPEPPPRSPSTRASRFGLDPYLVPK